jgi:hypothetical protein
MGNLLESGHLQVRQRNNRDVTEMQLLRFGTELECNM